MKDFRRSLLIAGMVSLTMMLQYRSMAATYSGTVVSSTDNSTPVAGVLVAAGYGLDRTLTDSSGHFSLVVTESAVLPRTFNSRLKELSIAWNIQQRSIDLADAPEVVSVSLFRLNGARIWKGLRDKEKRILKTPPMTPGVCLAVFSRSDGSSFAYRSVSGAGGAQWCRITAPRHTVPAGNTVSALGGGVTLLFRHDAFFPIDRQFSAPASDIVLTMKPDPRSVFFDQSAIHTFSFTLTNDDSLSMERNALAEKFTPAELTINGKVFGKVGLRYKGSNFYSMPRCFDAEGNRGTYADCRNVSMKVKFDKYADDARLYGMKRLNLHSMSYDDSKLREMLAYQLFRDCGIPTSRTVYVKVLVNGVSRGIFTGVEEIDGRFSKSRWPLYGDGNLYKEVWPIYAGADPYNNALKTNDDPEDSADVSRMVDFYGAIQGSTEQTFVADISPFIDIDYWLRYFVVDRAIHNADGIFTWYTSGEQNHNYYLYEDEAPNGKIWLIPWDMNATFARTDPIFDDFDVPEWNETPETCGRMEVWNGSFAIPPNCDPLTNLFAATGWDRFVRLGEQFLQELYTPERMLAHVDRLAAVIEPAMGDDPFVDNNTWRNNCNWVRKTMPILYKGFDDYLHGVEVVDDTAGFLTPFPGDSGFLFNRLNNFEFSSSVDISSWTGALVSDSSTISLLHDTVGALWGKADIRCPFVFRPADTTKTYTEWAVVLFNFAKATDCSGLGQIRIDLQMNSPTEVRVQLRSNVFERHGIPGGHEYGWSVFPGEKAKQFSLAVADVDYPEWVTHDRPELLDSVLAELDGVGLTITPVFDDNGQLKTVPDSGWIRIDNIRFVVGPN